MSVAYKPRINIVPHRSEHGIFIERGIVACRLHLSPPSSTFFYPALSYRVPAIRVSFARFHGETHGKDTAAAALRIAIITRGPR